MSDALDNNEDSLEKCNQVLAMMSEVEKVVPNWTSKYLNNLLHARKRSLLQREKAVNDLPDNVTDNDLKKAREASAVAVGKRKFYLPRPKEGYLILPSILLRSSFFTASASESDSAQFLTGGIPVLGSTNVLQLDCLPALGAKERRVLAACLQVYADSPLAIEGHDWMTVSLHKLLEMVGMSSGSHAYSLLDQALHKLSSVRFKRFVTKFGEVNVTSLVRLHPDSDSEGSRRKVKLRIDHEVAFLFGLAACRA